MKILKYFWIIQILTILLLAEAFLGLTSWSENVANILPFALSLVLFIYMASLFISFIIGICSGDLKVFDLERSISNITSYLRPRFFGRAFIGLLVLGSFAVASLSYYFSAMLGIAIMLCEWASRELNQSIKEEMIKLRELKIQAKQENDA